MTDGRDQGAADGVICEFKRLKALRASKSGQKSRCPRLNVPVFGTDVRPRQDGRTSGLTIQGDRADTGLGDPAKAQDISNRHDVAHSDTSDQVFRRHMISHSGVSDHPEMTPSGAVW